MRALLHRSDGEARLAIDVYVHRARRLAGARRGPSAPLRVLGYTNHGGTLDVAGMLHANSASADDVLAAADELLRKR